MLLAVGHRGRREDWVDRNLNSVFNHRRNDPRDVWTGQLQTRIRVDLDQPWMHILVNHEIISEDLEGKLASILVQFP